MARDDADETSDVDLLVSLFPGKSGLALGGLLMDVQHLLQRRVDVVTESSLHPALRERALKWVSTRLKAQPCYFNEPCGSALPGVNKTSYTSVKSNWVEITWQMMTSCVALSLPSRHTLAACARCGARTLTARGYAGK